MITVLIVGGILLFLLFSSIGYSLLDYHYYIRGLAKNNTFETIDAIIEADNRLMEDCKDNVFITENTLDHQELWLNVKNYKTKMEENKK